MASLLSGVASRLGEAIDAGVKAVRVDGTCDVPETHPPVLEGEKAQVEQHLRHSLIVYGATGELGVLGNEIWHNPTSTSRDLHVRESDATEPRHLKAATVEAKASVVYKGILTDSVGRGGERADGLRVRGQRATVRAIFARPIRQLELEVHGNKSAMDFEAALKAPFGTLYEPIGKWVANLPATGLQEDSAQPNLYSVLHSAVAATNFDGHRPLKKRRSA